MLSILVAVSVEEDSQSSEVVLVSEHWPHLSTLLGIPHCKPITKQVLPLAVDLEVQQQLPVVHPGRLKEVEVIELGYRRGEETSPTLLLGKLY